MKRRFWSCVGLVAASGMLFQAGGCAGTAEALAAQVIPLILQQLIAGALVI